MRIVMVLIALLAAIVAGFLWANRPVTVTISATPPEEFPADGFSHRTFEGLLQEYVDSAGDVDYHAWHASQQSVDRLNSYLAAVATYSPDSTPHRFDTRSDELAYWMYGYNAYVISGVLSNWPIDSVTDVRAPIEVVKGLGFFHRNRYIFGGSAYSLLTIENKKNAHVTRIRVFISCSTVRARAALCCVPNCRPATNWNCFSPMQHGSLYRSHATCSSTTTTKSFGYRQSSRCIARILSIMFVLTDDLLATVF